MDLLLNPNIAYLLLVTATFCALVALIAPGTGLPELIAVFSLALAAYAVYHLSFNWWALVLLILSLVPFFIAVRGNASATVRRDRWLALSILGLTAGSVFFFPVGNGALSVNPLLALLTSAVYAILVWFSARKVIVATQGKPMQDISILIGQSGETKTAIDAVGSVHVSGELWSARSEMPIPAGKPIKVVGREGFMLIVEKDGLRESELQKE